MVTCCLRYVIDPYKVVEFENYSKMWMLLVNKLGATHHGFFFPHEGPNNIAIALFSFPNLAAYEKYRAQILQDPDCQAAFKYAQETRWIITYERNFMRPILE